MKKYLMHVIWIVVAIAAFVGGMYYGKASASAPASTGRFGNFAGVARNGANLVARNGTGFVGGQVVSKDAQSLTVALPNGNSEIVFYSSSTAVEKPSPASMNDITPGTNVVIGGTQNSDGSVTAQTIQVRHGGATGGGSLGQ